MTDRFEFTVSVGAEELAYLRRRAHFLEAVIVQVLRDKGRVREWFSAAELAGVRLPGLPATKAGITRLARAGAWRVREVHGRGGIRFEYHVTSLPPRAFDQLIALIVEAVPEPEPERIELRLPAAPRPVPADDTTTAPPWTLPLLRLVKSGAVASVASAVARLEATLPPSLDAPTAHQVEEALARMGISLPA